MCEVISILKYQIILIQIILTKILYTSSIVTVNEEVYCKHVSSGTVINEVWYRGSCDINRKLPVERSSTDRFLFRTDYELS